MKYSTFVVLLSIWTTNATSQPSNALKELQGFPNTYYSSGSKDYASHIQNLLFDAIKYFEAEFGEELRVELYILNPNDAKQFGMRYPLPRSSDDPARIYMPEKGFLEFRLGNNRTFLGKNQFHASDFIAIHELGHIIKHKTDVKNHKWFGEFIATYFQIGYMKEKLPNMEYPTWGNIAFTFLPFRNKTLQDFDISYGGGPVNYVVYQLKFGELASVIFEEKKWSFVSESLELYDSLAKSGHDARSAFPIVISEISLINEDSAKWFDGMKHSWYPYPIIIFLLINCAITFGSYKRLKSKSWFIRLLLIVNFSFSFFLSVTTSIIYFL